VVELFDPARCATDCLLDATHPCSDATACAAHDDWRHVKEAYVGFLTATTLAALAARQK
jgi:DNA-binding IscR family transcriptional regulator